MKIASDWRDLWEAMAILTCAIWAIPVALYHAVVGLPSAFREYDRSFKLVMAIHEYAIKSDVK